MMGPCMPTGESMSDLEEMDGSQSEAEEEAADGDDSEEAPELVDMSEADLMAAIKANQSKRKLPVLNGSATGVQFLNFSIFVCIELIIAVVVRSYRSERKLVRSCGKGC